MFCAKSGSHQTIRDIPGTLSYRLVVTEELERVDLNSLSEEEQRVVRQVIEVLRKINFGTLLLVVQDGKVVQIEMAEKFRLR